MRENRCAIFSDLSVLVIAGVVCWVFVCVFDFSANTIKRYAHFKRAGRGTKRFSAENQEGKKHWMCKSWKFNFRPDDLYNDATILRYRIFCVMLTPTTTTTRTFCSWAICIVWFQIERRGVSFIRFPFVHSARIHTEGERGRSSRHSQLIVELIYSYLSRSSFFIVVVNAIVPVDGIFFTTTPHRYAAVEYGLRVRQTHPHTNRLTCSPSLIACLALSFARSPHLYNPIIFSIR